MLTLRRADRKPSAAKKACVACARAERTRETAPKRLLRGRKCAMDLPIVAFSPPLRSFVRKAE